MAKRSKPPKPKSSLLGHWRITWMAEWDQDYVDEDVEGYFDFEPDGYGAFQFGFVWGDIDYREGTRDGKLSVDFSWEGQDEMNPVKGRGWAVLDGDQMEGMIFIHQGDESAFKTKRKRQRRAK